MNNYNRFGDTSFRIKKQINFYQEIFQFIYEKFREIEDTKKDLDISIELELVKEYVFKNIVNYNEQKVSHGRIIIKQLEKFKLINFKNNQIFPTDIGKEVYSLLNCDYDFDKTSFIWFYIMINLDKKLSNIFNGFVKYIYENNINEISNELWISFMVSIDQFDLNAKVKHKTFSEKQIDKILESGQLQTVCKFRKPYYEDKVLPRLINVVISKNNDIDLKDEIIKILDNDKKLKETLKNTYSLNNKNISVKKIKTEQLIEYIIKEEKNLVNKVIEYKDIKTLLKDYKDINLRFFKDINFLQDDEKVNLEYKEYFSDLLKIKFDEKLENFKNYLNKTKFKFITIDCYPYTFEEILEMFNFIKEDKWLELKEKYPDFDSIANPTIYEYLINLSIFMSFNCEINQFKENCNTILDSKLKPRSHAPGGKSDGIAINKKGKPFATIEATIISNFEQILKNEQTSIQRHSFEYFQKLKITPSIIFVINKIDNNKEQLINRFVSKRYSSYFNDEEILIKTIVLTIEEMIKYIEHKCLDKIENIFDKVPIDFEANKSNNKYKMYADILNDIIN